MKLLCTGDLHLGRRSSRISVPQVDGSARGVWERVVRRAITDAVDAVLLSGDVVDEANRYFEAVGPLERGLRQLRDAGIAVVAVAGNHDHDVLPAVARALPDGAMHLLGAGGHWQRHTVSNSAGERLHVDGWSFPGRHAPVNPLASYQPPVSDGAPVVGLLHTDLDVAGSRYAPTTRDALQAQPMCCWLLGHVHAGGHRERTGQPPLLYAGSPQPLDPGEPGEHGAWMLDVSPSGDVHTQLLPLATVRYDTVAVDLASCVELQDARDVVRAAVQQWSTEMLQGCPNLEHVAVRLHLTGRTTLHATLAPLAGELLSWHDLFETGDGHPVSVSVTHVELRTRGHYQLHDLAARRDAIGWLAAMLQQLEAQDSTAIDPALWETLRSIPAEVQRARPYQGVELAAAWDDAAVTAAVTRQAERLLDTLLAQVDGHA